MNHCNIEKTNAATAIKFYSSITWTNYHLNGCIHFLNFEGTPLRARSKPLYDHKPNKTTMMLAKNATGENTNL